MTANAGGTTIAPFVLLDGGRDSLTGGAKMIDINLIREQPDVVRDGMVKRGIDPAPVDEAVELDVKWRLLLKQGEKLKAERNKVSKEIGKMKDEKQRQEKIEAMRQVADEIKSIDEELRVVEEELNQVMSIIPNVPDEKVPEGFTDDDNIEVKRWGEHPEFDFDPKPHWELGPELGIIDFERGVKLSGTAFMCSVVPVRVCSER